MPSVATAQDGRFDVQDNRLVVTDGDVKGSTILPCAPKTWAGDATRLYGACPSGGLLVVDVSQTAKPKPLEVIAFDSPVVRVFTIQGDLWFELENGAARPLDPVAPQPQDSTVDEASDEETQEDDEAPQEEPKEDDEGPSDETSDETDDVTEEDEEADEAPMETIRGKIIQVTSDSAVVDVGSSRGIKEGDRFAILVEDVRNVAGEEVRRERELGVGEVKTVTEKRAVIELPLNVMVPEGAYAQKTSRPASQNRYVAPELRSISNLSVNVRPFLALGTLGGGAVLDAAYTYRFEAPVALDVKLTPFAFGIARDGDILTFAGNAFLSYDTKLFQIGLGAGVSQINDGRVYFVPESEGRPSATSLGFSAAQFVRLGSPDGLNVELVNNFVLIDEEFEFGGIDIKATIPTSTLLDRTWLIVRGGGGVPGYIYGEVGIRVLGIGNGGPGSVFFMPTVGFVTLDQDEYEACTGFDPRTPDNGVPEETTGYCAQSSTAYGGPMVGFGVDWRF